MDALVMCGGRGTRLDATTEKPLVEVGGCPTVDRVLDALAGGRVDRVHAVVSPHTPATREHLADRRERRADGSDAGTDRADRPAGPSASLALVDAPGDGYVPDLGYALERVDRPVLTVAADLPLLAPDAVDAVLDAHAAVGADAEGNAGTDADGLAPSLTVSVPAALKEALGASVDTTYESGGRRLAPTGVNVVAGDADTTHMTYDARLAVNVNRPSDLALAEALS
jgi:adenosylcobinamide-phosphate guanylyltransferase